VERPAKRRPFCVADKSPRQCTFEQLKQKAVDPRKLLK